MLGRSGRPGSAINNTIESAEGQLEGLVKLDIYLASIGTKSPNN